MNKVIKVKTGEINLDGCHIPFILSRKKVKNINLRFGDGVLKISAPFSVPESYVNEIIYKNKDSILKSINSFKDKKHYGLKNRILENGDKILFLGQERPLKFCENIEHSFFDGENICIKMRKTDNSEKIRREAEIFLNNFCCEFLKGLYDEIYEQSFKDKFQKPSLVFKSLKSRWGSCCKAKGVITLNKRLVFLPPVFARYVVVHEFCHMLVFDHSKAFYAEVEKVMPDYKKIKDIEKEYRE